MVVAQSRRTAEIYSTISLSNMSMAMVHAHSSVPAKSAVVLMKMLIKQQLKINQVVRINNKIMKGITTKITTMVQETAVPVDHPLHEVFD